MDLSIFQHVAIVPHPSCIILFCLSLTARVLRALYWYAAVYQDLGLVEPTRSLAIVPLP